MAPISNTPSFIPIPCPFLTIIPSVSISPDKESIDLISSFNCSLSCIALTTFSLEIPFAPYTKVLPTFILYILASSAFIPVFINSYLSCNCSISSEI